MRGYMDSSSVAYPNCAKRPFKSNSLRLLIRGIGRKEPRAATVTFLQPDYHQRLIPSPSLADPTNGYIALKNNPFADAKADKGLTFEKPRSQIADIRSLMRFKAH